MHLTVLLLFLGRGTRPVGKSAWSNMVASRKLL